MGQVVKKAHVILWFPHAVLERSQSQGLQIESLEQMELVSAELPAHNEKPSLPNGRHLNALFCAGAVTLCAFVMVSYFIYTHTSTIAIAVVLYRVLTDRRQKTVKHNNTTIINNTVCRA